MFLKLGIIASRVDSVKVFKVTIAGLLLSAQMLLPVSPLVGYLGWSGVQLSLFLNLLYLLYNFKLDADILDKKFLSFIIIVFLFSLVPVFIYGDLGRISHLLVFFLSYYLTFSIIKTDINNLADCLSLIIIFFIIGALLAFFWKLVGGGALLGITNPDGRVNLFFPFSFSNSVWHNFLRPSSIFDEPGAFSFFICSIATLRQLMNKNEVFSFWLLLSGMITFSLAHVIFIFFFILSMNNRVYAFKWIVIFTLVFYQALTLLGLYDTLYNVFLIRFELDGFLLHGDNRSENMIRVYSYLMSSPSSFWVGHSQDILKDNLYYAHLVAGGLEVGANPLNLLSRFGLFGSISYYIIIISLWYLCIHFNRLKWCIIGFSLLLLQRDYLFVISYSFAILLIWRVVLLSNKDAI